MKTHIALALALAAGPALAQGAPSFDQLGAMNFQSFANAGANTAAPATKPAVPASLNLVKVDLTGLVDLPWKRTDSYKDAAGNVTYVSGSLDLNGDGWLAVTPPSGGTKLIKMAADMSGSWSDGGKTFAASLDASLFRAKYDNILQIKAADTGAVVWQRTIADLFAMTYQAGKAVTISGVPYRLFISHLPGAGSPAAPSSKVGVLFVYEVPGASGSDRFQFFKFDADSLKGPQLSYITLYGGAPAYVALASDLTSIQIAR